MDAVARVAAHAKQIGIAPYGISRVSIVTGNRRRGARTSAAKHGPGISRVKVTVTAAPISIKVASKRRRPITKISRIPKVTIAVPIPRRSNVPIPVAEVTTSIATATATKRAPSRRINQSFGATGRLPSEIWGRAIIGASRTSGRATVTKTQRRTVTGIKPRWRRETRRHHKSC